MSDMPHVGPANIRPGEEFFDAAGRLRRTCAHCGAVIPYGTFGVRRYCGKRCKKAGGTRRAWTCARPRMAGDAAYPYPGRGARLYGRRVRRRRVRRGSGGGSGKANGAPEEGSK